jgi:cytochrome b6-f complex iron-sulfur subunit
LLKTTAIGPLLLALPAGCNNGVVSPPSGPVAAGNVSETKVGVLSAVTGAAVILGRDAGGLYAMSASCTHAGCLLAVTGAEGAEQLYCPCHGSLFDASGDVTRGPARAALPHYRVDVAADGSITIQGGEPVAPDTRMPV